MSAYNGIYIIRIPKADEDMHGLFEYRVAPFQSSKDAFWDPDDRAQKDTPSTLMVREYFGNAKRFRTKYGAYKYAEGLFRSLPDCEYGIVPLPDCKGAVESTNGALFEDEDITKPGDPNVFSREKMMHASRSFADDSWLGGLFFSALGDMWTKNEDGKDTAGGVGDKIYADIEADGCIEMCLTINGHQVPVTSFLEGLERGYKRSIEKDAAEIALNKTGGLTRKLESLIDELGYHVKDRIKVEFPDVNFEED